ncbi:hypothetical protein BDR22DRAFT_824261 [Usnea florida]
MAYICLDCPARHHCCHPSGQNVKVILNRIAFALFKPMPWPTRCIYCTNVVCALFSISQPTVGKAFTPRNSAASAAVARRVCVPATPDVSKSSNQIIADICNQAPANESLVCSDQLTKYIQQSVTETCGQYFRLFADCLVSNDVNPAACSDSLYGYQDCSNYTMQAYAYCGCYYTVPSSLADCANEQLQSQTQDTAPVVTTGVRTTIRPTDSDDVPSSASADREAAPAIPSAQLPSVPTLPTTSQSQPTPSSVPDTLVTPNAARNTSFGPTTIITTYTTTSPATAHTTPTSLNPPASTITVYTCPANANDEPLPPPTPSPSLPASITTLDTPTPHSMLPATPNTASPRIDVIANASTTRGQNVHQKPSPSAINETQTSQTSGTQGPSPSSSSSSSPSTAPLSDPQHESSGIFPSPSISTFPSPPPPALNTATPSSTFLEGGTADRNGGALCGGCRRRSKIFGGVS